MMRRHRSARTPAGVDDLLTDNEYREQIAGVVEPKAWRR